MLYPRGFQDYGKACYLIQKNSYFITCYCVAVMAVCGMSVGSREGGSVAFILMDLVGCFVVIHIKGRADVPPTDSALND